MLAMQFRLVVALLGFVSILPIRLSAQVPPEATSSPAATATALPATTPPPGAATSAANATPFDPAAAAAAYLATVPAEKRAKSDAYFEGGYWLILWEFLLSAAVTIFLLQSGISARLRDFAERILWDFVFRLAIFIVSPQSRIAAKLRELAERLKRFKPAHVLIYSLCFILIAAVLTFPLTVYEQFFREHKYGLATQTFGPWFADQVKALRITLILFSISLIILYAVFRRAPRTWWIWGTIVVVCLNILGSFIAPVYIYPLFNKYTPLEDPAIRDPILAMARANQIPVKQVFEFDASRQTTRISANVAGFFGTTRIALNDNLLKQCTLPEIRAVMAHEMGHYVLNHSAKLVMYQGVLFLFMFALTAALFNFATRKWGNQWGVRGIADPAGLPLLALILSMLSFFLTPVTNSITRVTEREADAFGINTAREPDGMAKVALKLGSYRKLDPTPLEEIIFFDHPSGRARIRMAMDWKAARLPCGEVR
jgi:STE24 endopeptidase